MEVSDAGESWGGSAGWFVCGAASNGADQGAIGKHRDSNARHATSDWGTLTLAGIVEKVHTLIARDAPKAFRRFSSSEELAKHNEQKRALSFSPSLEEMPPPEYRRYGDPLLIAAEATLAKRLQVGTVALYPSRFSALMNAVYSYVDTRDIHNGAARKVLVDESLAHDPVVRDFFVLQLPQCGVAVEFYPAESLAQSIDGHFLVVMKGDEKTAGTVRDVSAALRQDERWTEQGRTDAGLIVTTAGDSEAIRQLVGAGATVVVGNADSVKSSNGAQLGMGLVAGGATPGCADPTIWQIRERRGLYGHAPDLLNESALTAALYGDGDPTISTRTDVLRGIAHRVPELVARAEAMLAELEGYPAAMIFNSGMQAVTTALAVSVKPGDFLIVPANLYRNTLRFTNQSLRARGVEVRVLDYSKPEEIEGAIAELRRDNSGRKGVLYFESPTIPYLRVTDPEVMGDIGRRHDLRVIVDSTVASPVNQQPVKFIDPENSIVLHSLTKLGQLNLGLGGGMSASQSIIDEARQSRPNLPGAFETVELIRNLPTIRERVEKQNLTGLEVCEFLRSDPDAQRWVKRLWYPADSSHPDYEVAQKVHPDKGGLMIYLKLDLSTIPDQREFGYLAASRAFVDATGLPNAASFGGPETLIQVPVDISYSEFDRPVRNSLFGVDDDVLRLAFGLEEPEYIIAALKRGFAELNSLYG